jgi:hypothetical protein
VNHCTGVRGVELDLIRLQLLPELPSESTRLRTMARCSHRYFQVRGQMRCCRCCQEWGQLLHRAAGRPVQLVDRRTVCTSDGLSGKGSTSLQKDMLCCYLFPVVT